VTEKRKKEKRKEKTVVRYIERIVFGKNGSEVAIFHGIFFGGNCQI